MACRYVKMVGMFGNSECQITNEEVINTFFRDFCLSESKHCDIKEGKDITVKKMKEHYGYDNKGRK